MANYEITKWCKSISDSGKDEYTHKDCKGMPHKFRLLDDDGIVYCYGQCSSNQSFAPLKYTGEGYGCTSIEYKDKMTKLYKQL